MNQRIGSWERLNELEGLLGVELVSTDDFTDKTVGEILKEKAGEK